MSRGLIRLVAGPVVAAGIIGGALGMAGVANASIHGSCATVQGGHNTPATGHDDNTPPGGGPNNNPAGRDNPHGASHTPGTGHTVNTGT
jgi:hypothetical protein